ncbi:MAG TPA: chitodextrinase, partial [Colwellia sp.]|nr:chitodextrinase [Colwellia sp.]
FEREECKQYVGQKAGSFIWDGSDESVQGCGWWGRGVIQTTGRQNFGTLNHFVGRSHVDPDTIGTTIDGTTVEAAPDSPLYADLDLCSNPGLICSSEEHKEIKWIAGLFFWVSSVQAYDNEGGPYADWNYHAELKKYVDGGMVGTAFVDAVSGIVNRGCPDDHCPVSGEVHAIEERRANFKLVLEKLGLNPQ